MNIYCMKIALHGITPMVWRRLRVPGNTSLAVLHHVIQILFNWDEYNLHQFHIYGKDYGLNYIGAVMYSDDANKVVLDDFQFDVGDKFTYEYNFFEHNMHDIRIETIKDLLTVNYDISCLSGSGMVGATKYDVIQVEYEMLEKLVKQKGKITIEDIHEFQDKINHVSFNKLRLNQSLSSLIT